MNKTKKLNRWIKNSTNMDAPGYINKNRNKNKLSKEEEKNTYYSKKFNNQDNSETSDDDMSSSISTASIGHILKKAFSSLEIANNTNNANKNNFTSKKYNKKKFRTNKEPETNKFQGSFSISSLNGKTELNTIISNKSKDKKGIINQVKIKSKSIKEKDIFGKKSLEKKESYKNMTTGEIKYMYKKTSMDKLFKKVNKINTNTGNQEEYIEYEDLKVNQRKNKKKPEDFDIYFWSYKEKEKKPEENEKKLFSNASYNKLKVGERKYHKKKVF